MSSIGVGLIAVVAFILILNGFSAGMVAIIHFWRGAHGVMKRALYGALGSGLACLLLTSGAIFTNDEGPAITAAVIGVLVAFGFLISLPGAYILSRKIGDRVAIDPDTFR